jgi:hypothetical protein
MTARTLSRGLSPEFETNRRDLFEVERCGSCYWHGQDACDVHSTPREVHDREVSQFVEEHEPEWLRRRRDGSLRAKDLTGGIR